MRGNGLQAQQYVAVADLDPGTADLLLAALRDRGVAAYAAASPEPPPGASVDRLYVDAQAADQARALVHDEIAVLQDADDDEVTGDLDLPPAENHGGHRDELDDPLDDDIDIEAEFAAIVAGWDLPAAAAPGAWPAGEEVEPAPGRAAPPGPTGGAPAAGSYMGWDDLLRPLPEPGPEPEEGYKPPPPPPLPETDALTRVAWAAVLGGPAVLFAAVLLGWHLEDWMMLVAAIAFVVGFVVLVARLGDREDDGDDGAVV
jgi:general stress protein CsbA